MKPVTLFIADLHLNEQQPEVYQRFLLFLKDKARKARALYILGDLFEYYLGDDAQSEFIQKVGFELGRLSNEFNTDCYFMPGNRDFLLLSQFSPALKILQDPTVIDLDGDKVLLTHADELCTDDVEYQKIRKQLRSQKWQHWFLSLSIDERIAFAKQARQQSQEHTQSQNNEIMDVNQGAVEQLFRECKVRLMIHGHTHRPAFHSLEVDSLPCIRMVLGDWHNQCSTIENKNNTFRLLTY